MQFFIDEILEYGELKEKLLANPEICARGKAEAEKIIAAGRYLPVEDGLTQVAAAQWAFPTIEPLPPSRMQTSG